MTQSQYFSNFLSLVLLLLLFHCREMNTQNFLNHLELLYEERLVEKTSLNIKIIEVFLEFSKTSKNFLLGCV